MSRLPKEFWAKPFAHRGLHDSDRPENSLSAIIAAAELGYAIELDVQPSADGEAMVFHDYTLDRVANATGRTDVLKAAELSAIKLKVERRVCDIVRAAGQIEACAIMSFNPFSADHVRQHLPEIARGVVSYDFEHPHDANVDASYRADLAALKWFEETGADFVSYGAASFPSKKTQELRSAGVPIFCWTIRSNEQAEAALHHCDQITFEGYRP